MPRHPRVAPGGFVYHALNRGVARLPLFEKEGDYAAFERVLAEALVEHPTRILASLGSTLPVKGRDKKGAA